MSHDSYNHENSASLAIIRRLHRPHTLPCLCSVQHSLNNTLAQKNADGAAQTREQGLQHVRVSDFLGNGGRNEKDWS